MPPATDEQAVTAERSMPVVSETLGSRLAASGVDLKHAAVYRNTARPGPNSKTSARAITEQMLQDARSPIGSEGLERLRAFTSAGKSMRSVTPGMNIVVAVAREGTLAEVALVMRVIGAPTQRETIAEYDPAFRGSVTWVVPTETNVVATQAVQGLIYDGGENKVRAPLQRFTTPNATPKPIIHAANRPTREKILTAMKEWRDDPVGFLTGIGSREARSVYLLDPIDPMGVLYPLKAVAKRVLGDLGPNFTTRRYEAHLKPELFGFEVITASDQEMADWVSQDEEDMDAVEGNTAEILVLKRQRNRRIIASFKWDRMHAGSLACDKCGVTGETLGGEKVPTSSYPSLFDADHQQPLWKGERVTRKQDLNLLCPNCHRVRHVTERINAASMQSG